MVTPIATYVKDPNATLDYTVDWAAWLSGVSDTSLPSRGRCRRG